MDSFNLTPIRNGDKAAYAELLMQFDPLIKTEVSNCIRKLPNGCEYDADELASEAMMALYKAAITYESDKNVTFGLYAKICIHNRLISCARSMISRFRKQKRLEEHTSRVAERGAEESFITEASREEIVLILKRETSELEMKIFSLYLEKKSYAEISEMTGKNIKSVGNAIYRVRRKLREQLTK